MVHGRTKDVDVKSYGQYCPIARSSEILAQRWTPLIIRTLLNGPSTYGNLADQAPGIPRSLLTARLRELETMGLCEKSVDGKYELTPPGSDLGRVIAAMGEWGERWLEVTPEHADPVYFLNSWVNTYLAVDLLPPHRVVVRFDLTDQPAQLSPMWVVFDRDDSEVCREYPGFEEDLVVQGESVALAEWHLGRLEWGQILKSGRISVGGAPTLARRLPTWNRRSRWVDADHPV